MNEIELLSRLRAEVPPVVSARAEDRFLAALRAPGGKQTGARGPTPLARTPTRMRRIPVRSRLAIAGGLTLALTGGLLGAATIPLGGAKPPASASAADLLATRAAAAAAAQPAVSPGQWIYSQLLDRALGHSIYCVKPGQHPAAVPCTSAIKKDEAWFTADGTRNATIYRGKLIETGGPPMPVRYADLGRLPRDPAAVVTYIAKNYTAMAGASTASAAFRGIFALLDGYMLPHAVAARLYLALADIPGVTVNRHVTDLAGRTGPAFTLKVTDGPGSYTISELILNPHTYTLMGFTEADYGPTTQDRHAQLQFSSDVAILRHTAVSGPGVRP